MIRLSILLSIILLLNGCGLTAEEKANIKKHKADSIATANIDMSFIENDTLTTNLIDTLKNNWSSNETGLPIGVVIKMDYGHDPSGDATKDLLNDNYVMIRKSDGLNTIVRDVDVDLYLNLSIGDKIH